MNARLYVLSLLLLITFTATSDVDAQGASNDSGSLVWQNVAPGYEIATYSIADTQSGLSSEILLVKLSPQAMTFTLGVGDDVSSNRSDVKSLTIVRKGVVGINANFFSPDGSPIGVVIRDGTVLNKIHRGGKLLTDIFYIKDSHAAIVGRDEFDPSSVSVAVQSGPRLIKNGKATTVVSKDVFNRRSGVAITREGTIVLFATQVRFPGVSFAQLQTMLLSLEIGVTDAMSFDGGGSSQLYLRKYGALATERLVSGGDVIPVALVAVPK